MWVSLNMAMSIDGKIATAKRGPVKLGSPYDSRRMAEIRAMHGAVINGASTFMAHPFPLLVKGSALVAQRVKLGLGSQPISAVVSSRLKIPSGTPWETAEGVERWIFCGRLGDRKIAKRLQQRGILVVYGRGDRPSPGDILSSLAKRGVKSLLLEGGGEFNASFLERGLVHRIYLTVVPLLVGGASAPTWFEGEGFPMGKFPRFRLKEARQKGQELYLTYEKPGSKGGPFLRAARGRVLQDGKGKG